MRIPPPPLPPPSSLSDLVCLALARLTHVPAGALAFRAPPGDAPPVPFLTFYKHTVKQVFMMPTDSHERVFASAAEATGCAGPKLLMIRKQNRLTNVGMCFSTQLERTPHPRRPPPLARAEAGHVRQGIAWSARVEANRVSHKRRTLPIDMRGMMMDADD